MLVVVPLAGLLLAGCGGGGSTTADPTTPDEATTSEQSVDTSATTPSSSQRYDVSAVTVCDAVETALAGVGAEPGAQATQTALTKALTTMLKSSTTPKATILSADVDRIMNRGCPALRAQSLSITDLTSMAQLDGSADAGE